MGASVLTLFNNKGGVGKTSLIYHLAWIWAEMGRRIVTVDLDPQANLTAVFLPEAEIEQLWEQSSRGGTIYQCVAPLAGGGEIVEPRLREMSPNLFLLPGDVGLSAFEESLSEVWPSSMGDNNLYRPMRILSAFWQVIRMAAARVEADLVVVDIGPNLGAINRSVLLGTDCVVIPLGADFFSLQGLRNLGPTLKSWKRLWKKRLINWNESEEKQKYPDFSLPEGAMQPLGYLCQQHSVRLNRPVQAYEKWVRRIPDMYRQYVLEEEGREMDPQVDPCCLATVRQYRTLVPMAQEKRKPIFNLTPADGAVGSHAGAVADAGRDFRALAKRIEERMGAAGCSLP